MTDDEEIIYTEEEIGELLEGDPTPKELLYAVLSQVGDASDQAWYQLIIMQRDGRAPELEEDEECQELLERVCDEYDAGSLVQRQACGLYEELY
ncbi:MAG: hypothetical protein ABH846_02885 [Patescibacteria group bacterium]